MARTGKEVEEVEPIDSDRGRGSMAAARTREGGLLRVRTRGSKH